MNSMIFIPRRWLSSQGLNPASRIVRDDIDNSCQKLGRGEANEAQGRCGILPSVDLLSNEDAYALSMEIPGVEPEDVTLEVREDSLVIEGEKKHCHQDEAKKLSMERVFGKFHRSWTLPEDADREAISATHKNGVLTVIIPRKAEPEPQIRAIEITKQ